MRGARIVLRIVRATNQSDAGAALLVMTKAWSSPARPHCLQQADRVVAQGGHRLGVLVLQAVWISDGSGTEVPSVVGNDEFPRRSTSIAARAGYRCDIP